MATSAVSKAALVHLTRVLDLELFPLGIRVNAVAPQILDTAKNRQYLTPDLLAHAVAPEAFADIIGYLVSDAAALGSGRHRPRKPVTRPSRTADGPAGRAHRRRPVLAPLRPARSGQSPGPGLQASERHDP
jgi:NAD(P)-dependent dehydrogenase (short-subunit alcohol dehydrogenase family)